MSDDLVKRLRGFPPNVHETMTEAADRIAELEAALKRWIEADDGGDGHECIHALSDARKLVEGKKDEAAPRP